MGADSQSRRYRTLKDHEPSIIRPDYRNFRIYCDESGMHGAPFYGFGSLWMPEERRGDFPALVRRLREAHGYNDEIKWSNVRAHNLHFFEALVDGFFRAPWLMFHCFIVKKAYVDRSRHLAADPMDLARRKHFTMLIQTKVKYFYEPGTKKAYHVIIDPFPSRYAKADEAAEKILKNELKPLNDASVVTKVSTSDSKLSPGIQLADLLIGSVVTEWNEDKSGAPKTQLRAHVAKYLGWADLKADTHMREWKFNIWSFHDPTTGESRDRKTRGVQHLVTTPPFRRSRGATPTT